MFRRVRSLISLSILVLALLASTLSLAPTATAASQSVNYVGVSSARAFYAHVTVAAPRATRTGDLQVAVIGLGSSGAQVATPAGWSRVLERSGAGFRSLVFVSRSTKPVTFRTSGRRAWQVVRSAYRGAAGVVSAKLVLHRGRSHTFPAVQAVGNTERVVGGLVGAGHAFVTATNTYHKERFDRVANPSKVGLALYDGAALSSGPKSGVVRLPQARTVAVFSLVLSSTSSAVRRQPKKRPVFVPKPTAPAPASPAVFSPSGLLATVTEASGLLWRPGTATNPGYTNHTLPASPVINAGETTLLRKLGAVLLNTVEYTEPIHYRTAGNTAVRTVRCVAYGCVGGSAAPLRGDEIVAPGTDGQLVVVDTAARRTYEFWQLVADPDGTVKINADGSVTAGSMSIVDIDGRGNRTADGKTLNITGAGVSRLFGVIRAHEVRAAATAPRTAIPHALSVSLPQTLNCSSAFREPATKTDGRATGACVQEGARVQLAPSYNCANVATKMGQAVCYALQKHGAYVMDNGSNYMNVYAQQQRSWGTGAADYKKAGVAWDYFNLGIPMTQIRSLASWTGR